MMPILRASGADKARAASSSTSHHRAIVPCPPLGRLLRLSPVLPFAWANYVFGLSPVPLAAFSVGTFVGCLPAVAGYVSAGKLGAEIAVNGADTSPGLLVLGVIATIGAITFAGNIATSALKDLNVDLE